MTGDLAPSSTPLVPPTVEVRRRPRWLIPAAIAVAVIVAAGVAAGVVALRSNAGTFTASGSLTLTDSSAVDPSIVMTGGVCQGGGGYDDLHQGTQVTVTDQTGAIVGVGQLAAGSAISSSSCQFLFTVAAVPAGRKFYGVAVSHRGSVQYTESQVRSGVELSIGS